MAQALAKASYCFLEQSEMARREAPPIPGVGEIRIERDGAVVSRQRRVGPAQLLQGIAAAEMIFGAIRPDEIARS